MHKALSAIMTGLIFTACSQTASTVNRPCQPSNVAGGYRLQEQISPEAKQAMEPILKQLNSSSKLKQILEVRTQVVAGTNYAIKFELANGEIWYAIVWHDLQGNFTLSQAASQTPFPALCN